MDGETEVFCDCIGDVIAMLQGLRLPLNDEKRLQSAIAEALTGAGIDFTPERELSAADRVDFLVSGGLAVECKLRGSKRQIFRQLQRYAAHDEVTALLLVTNTAMGLPGSITGKPVYYYGLGGAWL